MKENKKETICKCSPLTSLTTAGGSGNTWNPHILQAEAGETVLLWLDGGEPSTA